MSEHKKIITRLKKSFKNGNIDNMIEIINSACRYNGKCPIQFIPDDIKTINNIANILAEAIEDEKIDYNTNLQLRALMTKSYFRNHPKYILNGKSLMMIVADNNHMTNKNLETEIDSAIDAYLNISEYLALEMNVINFIKLYRLSGQLKIEFKDALKFWSYIDDALIMLESDYYHENEDPEYDENDYEIPDFMKSDKEIAIIRETLLYFIWKMITGEAMGIIENIKINNLGSFINDLYEAAENDCENKIIQFIMDEYKGRTHTIEVDNVIYGVNFDTLELFTRYRR